MTGKERGLPGRLRLGFLLRQAHVRAATELTDALSPLGLTGRHFGVLIVLSQTTSSTMSALTGQLGSDNASMVRTLDDLEARDAITRTRSTIDRRVVDLALTTAGRRLLQRALSAADAVDQVLFRAFTNEETEVLALLLGHVINAPAATRERVRGADNRPVEAQ